MALAKSGRHNANVVPEGSIKSTSGDEVRVAGAFVTTRWTVVQSARNSDSPEAEAALEELCRTYWPPIHTYVRRFGCPVEDCRDLTQGFFCKLLEKNWLAAANRERGKFRTFLLSTLKHFLADERDRAAAIKRGGGRVHLSLDGDFDENLALSDAASPEKAFDHQWALTVLAQAIRKLQQEFKDLGKGGDFDVLKNFIVLDAAPISHHETAARLGITEGAAKMSVSRMRQRFRQLVRAEVAHTVQNEADVEEEIRYLMEILRE